MDYSTLAFPLLSLSLCSISYPLSRWCHPTISSSVVHFSSCPQSFQHQGLFQWVGSSYQVAKVLNHCPMFNCSVVSDSSWPHGQYPARVLCPWGFSRQEYWSVGCYFLLQGIFPTQESNPGFPHCRDDILYHLSHRGRLYHLSHPIKPLAG